MELSEEIWFPVVKFLKGKPGSDRYNIEDAKSENRIPNGQIRKKL